MGRLRPRVVGGAAVVAVVAGGLLAVPVAVPAGDAAAAGVVAVSSAQVSAAQVSAVGQVVRAAVGSPGQGSAFDCTGGTIYTLQRGTTAVPAPITEPGNLYALSTTNLGSTVTATLITSIPQGGYTNGLGLTRGGAKAYVVDQAVQPAGATSLPVHGYDTATQTWTTYPGTLPSDAQGGPSALLAGAVDPATNVYYYATYQADGTIDIFGFDTTTNTALPGVVATTTVPVNTGTGVTYNGDIAFDAAGNLYIVSAADGGAGVGVVRGGLPAAGSANYGGAVTDTFLGALTASGTYNGIAFDNLGHLFVQYTVTTGAGDTSVLAELNPNTGAVIAGPATETTTGFRNIDLGACSLNPTLQLEKNVDSRANPGDRFALSITGAGVTDGNTATTTGTATGLQQTAAGATVTAGPVLGVSGDTYTVAEAGADGADLADYTTTYQCTDTNTGSGSGGGAGGRVVASGSGTQFDLTFPSPAAGETGAAVTCVFTNTARQPAASPTSTPTNPTPPPTPPAPPAAGMGGATQLAATGGQLTALLGGAIAVLITGLGLLLLGRTRRRRT